MPAVASETARIVGPSALGSSAAGRSEVCSRRESAASRKPGDAPKLDDGLAKKQISQCEGGLDAA